MTVEWDVEALISEAHSAAVRVITSSIENVKTTAVTSILTGPKTGIIYKRGDSTHQASAPREAPANDSGHLVGTARTEVDADLLEGVVIFGSGENDYAAALEFGREDGHIEARPYARPALAEEREKFEDAIAAAVKEVF